MWSKKSKKLKKQEIFFRKTLDIGQKWLYNINMLLEESA